jgi:arabinan endo-1,5-alpha-L-arabinosidase
MRMTSRRGLQIVACHALVVCACQGSADTVAASYGDYDPERRPVVFPLQGDIALNDPTLFHWRDTYWVFSTGAGIAVHSSTDLVTFQLQTQVFEQNPPWIGQLLPQVTDLWSPDVHTFGGLIHLYYAASTFGSNHSCIGHAITTAIGEPFVDQGPLICTNVNGTTDDYNAIDPAVFMNAPDDPWLVLGSYESGIKLIGLDRNGNRRDTQMYPVAARPPDNPAIQASYLYRWRDYFYLFVSFDACCAGVNSTHNLRVGRSTQLLGPYLDRDGQPMLEGGGTLVLAGDSRFKGPGSNMIFDGDGQRLNVYHAYDSNRNGTAVLRIASLFFDNDGWPVTTGTDP